MKTIKQFKAEELEEIIETGVTLVDFNAPWCPPCRAQAPVIKALASKFKESAKVITLNVDDNRQFATKRGITSIPTLVLYRDGQEVRRFVGLQKLEVLSKAITETIK